MRLRLAAARLAWPMAAPLRRAARLVLAAARPVAMLPLWEIRIEMILPQAAACQQPAGLRAWAATSRVSAAICQVVGLVYLTLMFNSLHSLVS